MRANFTNTTGCSQEAEGYARPALGPTLGRTVIACLVLRHQTAGPYRLRSQHAEQVEVGGLLIVEQAHLVPGPGGGVEHLEPVWCLYQAHRPVDLLAHRVGGRRYRRQAG